MSPFGPLAHCHFVAFGVECGRPYGAPDNGMLTEQLRAIISLAPLRGFTHV